MPPLSQPEADPAQDSFKSVLRLLRHTWIRDFLFPRDSSTYHGQLWYAMLQPNLTLNDVKIVTYQTNATSKSEDGSHECLHILEAPSFSTGNQSASFAIIQRYRTANPLHRRAPMHIGRTVRDDESGVFLLVVEHTLLGLTEIIWYSQTSPGVRSKGNILVILKSFRRLMASFERGFDWDLFRLAVLRTQYTVEMRPCPNCGSDTVTMCSCKLVVKAKGHPQDHENEIKIVFSYAGRFEGFGTFHIYKQGRRAKAENFASNFHMVISSNTGLRQSLLTWATWDSVRTHSVNITKLVMPNIGSDESAARRSHCSDTGENQEVVRNTLESEPRRDYFGRLLESYPSGTLTRVCDAEIKRPRDSDIHARTPYAISASFAEHGIDTKSSHPTKQQEHVHSSASHETPPPQRRYRRLRPSAPLDDILAERDREIKRIAEEADRKTALRRARNREFAKRSYERKRLHLQGLRNDIAAASEKVAKLVQREKALQEENKVLKAVLSTCAGARHGS